MRRIATTALILSLGLLGACEVNVDNNLADAAENSADSLGNTLESAAEDVGNAVEPIAEDAGNELEKAGDAIANGAGELRNGVDVDVRLGDDDRKAANSQ
jgi:hypothetical protein